MLTEGKPDSVTNDDMKESLRPSKEQSMEKTNDVEKEASQEKESSTGSAQDTEKTDEPILPLTSISFLRMIQGKLVRGVLKEFPNQQERATELVEAIQVQTPTKIEGVLI